MQSLGGLAADGARVESRCLPEVRLGAVSEQAVSRVVSSGHKEVRGCPPWPAPRRRRARAARRGAGRPWRRWGRTRARRSSHPPPARGACMRDMRCVTCGVCAAVRVMRCARGAHAVRTRRTRGVHPHAPVAVAPRRRAVGVEDGVEARMPRVDAQRAPNTWSHSKRSHSKWSLTRGYRTNHVLGAAHVYASTAAAHAPRLKAALPSARAPSSALA
eukprot:scaffold73022_cov36-Phaeocystis_antarctica.AAC.2